MAGWRDENGRTAGERKRDERAHRSARLADTLRNQPQSLVRPIVSALFVGILVLALVNFLG